MNTISYCNWLHMTEQDKVYHDTEWGFPIHDDRLQFESLSLEVLQCGLNWSLILKKREIFRQCFDDFDIDKVATYSDTDVQRILETPEMIRSERKIRAIINNAKCIQKIQAQYGSFSSYLWAYSNGKTLLYESHAHGNMPTRNALSEKISNDLKKHGFKYTGAVTLYSHLQACGIINDHTKNCPCYQKITEKYPCTQINE